MIPETTIRITAKPGAMYRAVSDEIYEPTGRPVTSVWYSTQEEAVAEWAGAGFNHIEKADLRLEKLGKILDALTRAFHSGGSDAVTLELAKMEHEHAQDELHLAQAGMEVDDLYAREGVVKVAIGKGLSCKYFRDPDFDNWIISGLAVIIRFEREFSAGDGTSEPDDAREMHSRLRVSFSHEHSLTFHEDGEVSAYSISGYEATVVMGNKMHYSVPIDKTRFENVLQRHGTHFLEDNDLPTIGYSLNRAETNGTLVRRRSIELEHSLSWLKRVGGLEESYIAQWPDTDWEAWRLAMEADPNGANPVVPDWMNPIIKGTWHNDFSYPYPQVGQLFASPCNWFREAATHDDLTLNVDSEPGEWKGHDPLTQLEAVYEAALQRGWIPRLNVVLEPAERQKNVVGTVEALYIIAPATDSVAVKALLEEHHLPSLRDGKTGVQMRMSSLADDAGVKKLGGDLIVWGSEWMYG